jgi:hypothetical protein
MPPTDPFETTTHEFDQRKVTMSRTLSLGAFTSGSAEMALEQDKAYNELRYRLTAHVLAKHVGKGESTYRVVTPETWWQHFKATHFPQWAARRWPVKYRTHVIELEVDRWLTFPEADLRYDPELAGRPVKVVDFAWRERDDS